MTGLSRQEKEKLVLDLYFNQGKNYRQIAKEARISPREIKRILDKGADDVEEETPMSVWSKAYKLFDDGMSPVKVAIALNLRADKAIEFFKEFWELKQIHDFNKMYFETGGHLTPILKLYKMMNAAGYHVEQITRLLRLANNDLPGLERMYYNLKSDVASLSAEKQSSSRILEDYRSQIRALGKTFDNYCLTCQEEGTKLTELQQKRMKLEAYVGNLEINNSECVRIRKMAEEKAYAILSNSKNLLSYAVLSVTESIRTNPDKYSTLILSKMSSTMVYNNYQNSSYYGYGFYTYPQEQSLSRKEYAVMLIEEADKLYNVLVKTSADHTINDYSPDNWSPSLPFLPPPSQEGN